MHLFKYIIVLNIKRSASSYYIIHGLAYRENFVGDEVYRAVTKVENHWTTVKLYGKGWCGMRKTMKTLTV